MSELVACTHTPGGHRKETAFCGYSVPHPSEPKMNLRLQTCGGRPAAEVLKDGLHEMVEICDLLEYKLDAALAEYEKGQGGKGGKAKAGMGPN